MKIISALFTVLLFFTTLSAQSLENKIGQMLLVGLPPGDDAKDTLLTDIIDRNLGGVLMYGYNISTPDQIRSLNKELQSLSTDPLFLAVDQEGGVVARLDEDNGYEKTYSAETLGSFNSEDSTRSESAKMAGWLADAGFNLNFAPVVDVRVYRFSPAIAQLERSFSSNAEMVYKHASWFINEMHERQISTAIKHFPGHGSARDDSHNGFTDITDTWQERELDPYRGLIGDGYRDMVMTGHLYFETWDQKYPASLSDAAINQHLRDSLGFDGVVVSDELFMGAIQNNYGFDEAVVQAINAGTDILLFNTNLYNDQSLVRYVVDLVKSEVDKGNIAESTITEAYSRIKRLKEERISTNVDEYLATTELPDKISVSNYPNPFNPQTTIEVSISQRQDLSVHVYNLIGQQVANLVEGKVSEGVHSFTFNGAGLSSGIYLVRVQGAEAAPTHKITLVK